MLHIHSPITDKSAAKKTQKVTVKFTGNTNVH